MSDLVKAAGGVFEIIKALTEATIDHGGTDDHVRRILSNRKLLADLAKRIVGPVWDLVDQPISLVVDWESPLPEFVKRTSVVWAPNMLTEEDDSAETARKPSKPCQYTLVHYEKQISPEIVMQEQQVAGFRELCTYVSTVQVPPRTSIIALGSCKQFDGRVFAWAQVSHYASVSRIRELTHYNPSHFFLVRV